jgi:hypothetical protein
MEMLCLLAEMKTNKAKAVANLKGIGEEMRAGQELKKKRNTGKDKILPRKDSRKINASQIRRQ